MTAFPHMRKETKDDEKSWFVSTAVVKHFDRKRCGWEGGIFHLQLESIIKVSQGRNSRREPGVRHYGRGYGESLLPMARSVYLPIPHRITYPGVVLPTVAKTSHIRH